MSTRSARRNRRKRRSKAATRCRLSSSSMIRDITVVMLRGRSFTKPAGCGIDTWKRGRWWGVGWRFVVVCGPASHRGNAFIRNTDTKLQHMILCDYSSCLIVVRGVSTHVSGFDMLFCPIFKFTTPCEPEIRCSTVLSPYFDCQRGDGALRLGPFRGVIGNCLMMSPGTEA